MNAYTSNPERAVTNNIARSAFLIILGNCYPSIHVHSDILMQFPPRGASMGEMLSGRRVSTSTSRTQVPSDEFRLEEDPRTMRLPD